MGKITFTNKSDNRIVSVPEVNKVTAANINEIKASVNALYDILENAVRVISVFIEESEFSGNNYTNSLLIDEPDSQFLLITDGGSGVILKAGDGFTYDAAIGRITAEPMDYRLIIFKTLL